jgi:plastocyanin
MVRRYCPLAAAAWALLSVASPAAAAPHTYTVVIDKMKFGPVPEQLHKGDTIVWDNHDMFQHSATDKGVFDLDLPAGKKAALRLTRAGTFPFVCKYHPGMKGVLKVAP